MKDKKLKLNDLKVKSFVTEEDEKKGGILKITFFGCRTFFCTIIDCPVESSPESPCWI